MSLRMVEMVVSKSAEETLEEVAQSLTALGVWRETLEDDLLLVRILVQGDRTEPILHALESKYQYLPSFRVVLLEVQATLPHPPSEEEEEEKVEEEASVEAKEEPPRDPRRIACAELVQKLSEGTLVHRIFVATVLLSAIVATIGLVRDNVAVIIGAMVIAPLLGPNMTLSLATTLGDSKLALRSLKVNGLGLGLSLFFAAAIGAVLPFDPSVGEISSRTTVGLSDIVLALAAGSAGALAFTTGLSSALVGVMVAVALLPPLAATGLLAGAGQWHGAMGALLLTATNIVCINLAGVATFLWQGVRPRHWWESERASRMTRWAAALWLGLLAILIALIYLARG